MEADTKTRNKQQDWSLSTEDAESLITDSILEYNNHQDAVDVCDGVCLGKEHRLQTDKEMYYNLSYDEQTIHQSILVFEKDDADKGRRDRFNPNPFTPSQSGSLSDSSDSIFLEDEPTQIHPIDVDDVKRNNSLYTRILNLITNKKSENERG